MIVSVIWCASLAFLSPAHPFANIDLFSLPVLKIQFQGNQNLVIRSYILKQPCHNKKSGTNEGHLSIPQIPEVEVTKNTTTVCKTSFCPTFLPCKTLEPQFIMQDS